MKHMIFNPESGRYELRELTTEEIAQMEAMQQIEPTEPQPTLEQRVSEIEQVTTEVITVLNDKGIIV